MTKSDKLIHYNRGKSRSANHTVDVTIVAMTTEQRLSKSTFEDIEKHTVKY